MSYCPTIFFTKLSLLLLYLRLFSPNQTNKYAIYIGIMANLVFYATNVVIFGVLCLPRHGQTWLESLENTKCERTIVLEYAQGIFGVVSDFYLFLIPIPTVIKLKLPLRKKVGVLAIFATGFL